MLASVHSWTFLMKHFLSSSALVRWRESKSSSLLWTRKLFHAILRHLWLLCLKLPMTSVFSIMTLVTISKYLFKPQCMISIEIAMERSWVRELSMSAARPWAKCHQFIKFSTAEAVQWTKYVHVLFVNCITKQKCSILCQHLKFYHALTCIWNVQKRWCLSPF